MKFRYQTKLEKVRTRFLFPLTLQAWFRGTTSELQKVIGVGIKNVVLKFDGQKVEVFLNPEELQNKIKKAMLHYVKTKQFSNGTKEYNKLIKDYRQYLSKGKSIKKAMKFFEKIYPMFAVSYYVSNFWADALPDAKKEGILKLCKEYRILSEGTHNELDAFIAGALKKRNLSAFSIIKTSKKNDSLKQVDWLKKGYIFFNGTFIKLSWKQFLRKNAFYCVEDHTPIKSKLVRGSTAFKGKIKGIVKLVFSPSDFIKVKRGDILVTPMTQPNFIPVLNRVAGIITDEGGILCHAAIVARELKKPCIIGTKIATKIFKDGDMVEVDADKGVVKKV